MSDLESHRREQGPRHQISSRGLHFMRGDGRMKKAVTYAFAAVIGLTVVGWVAFIAWGIVSLLSWVFSHL